MKRIHFAANRTSWDEIADSLLPDSIAERWCEPIWRHLPEGSWTVGRQPVDDPDVVNAICNGWASYNVDRTAGTDVLISHGLADKGIRTRMAAQFDYVACPSELYADRLTTPAPRKPIVGAPFLDPILGGELEPLSRDERIRVLYAPTHGGGGEMHSWIDAEPTETAPSRKTSHWRRDEILTALDPDEFDVVECLHPRYRPGHTVTLREYVGADVVIADGGTTLWVALILGVPLVVPAWITGHQHSRARTLEGDLYRHQVGRHVGRPDHLASLLRAAAQAGPTPAEGEWGQRALPTHLRGVSGKTHAAWLVGLT